MSVLKEGRICREVIRAFMRMYTIRVEHEYLVRRLGDDVDERIFGWGNETERLSAAAAELASLSNDGRDSISDIQGLHKAPRRSAEFGPYSLFPAGGKTCEYAWYVMPELPQPSPADVALTRAYSEPMYPEAFYRGELQDA